MLTADASSGRGTQVVRERSAKPLCVGSIPTRASKVSITYSDRRKNWLPFGCQMAAKWFKTSVFQLRGMCRKFRTDGCCGSNSRFIQQFRVVNQNDVGTGRTKPLLHRIHWQPIGNQVRRAPFAQQPPGDMRQPKLARLGLNLPGKHIFMPKRRLRILGGKNPIRVSSVLELLESKEPLNVCWRQLNRAVHAKVRLPAPTQRCSRTFWLSTNLRLCPFSTGKSRNKKTGYCGTSKN
jgi:hypothetical protein